MTMPISLKKQNRKAAARIICFQFSNTLYQMHSTQFQKGVSFMNSYLYDGSFDGLLTAYFYAYKDTEQTPRDADSA